MANNEKQGKDTFILRCEFYPQIKRLEREQRGDLLDAIFAHASGADYPTMDGVTSMCFEFIRASMDAYAGKYDAKCLKNRENGQRGGRPRKADGNDDNQTGDLTPERLHENPADGIDSERLSANQADSEKTERFSDIPNGTKDNRAEANTPERIEPNPVDSEKTERVKNNHDSYSYSYSDSDSESDINTHTVISKKRGVGKNGQAPSESPSDVEAAKLIAWVEANVPTVAAMAEPLTEQNAVWMLRKYSVEDIQRIILAMHNKRAFENVNAYTTFGNFARRDLQLNGATANASTPAGPKPYTWDEVLVYVDRNRPKATTEDFERQVVGGRPVWFKKSDLLTSWKTRPN